jgi:hypothetical protein
MARDYREPGTYYVVHVQMYGPNLDNEITEVTLTEEDVKEHRTVSRKFWDTHPQPGVVKMIYRADVFDS